MEQQTKQKQILNICIKNSTINFEDLNQKDIIQFYGVEMSLKKLRTLLVKQRIPNFFNYVKFCLQNNQHCERRMLNFIPKQILPTVLSYNGKIFQSNTQFISPKLQKGKSVVRILKSVQVFSQINFSNLTILKFPKHFVNSVEGLSFLNAPKLKCLEMYENDITNLNILVKAYFPNLSVITFYHNPITQMDKFCRFHSKKLTGYQFDNLHSYHNRVEDYRFLFKMEASLPKMMKIPDYDRVNISKNRILKTIIQPGTKIIYNQPRPIISSFRD